MDTRRWWLRNSLFYLALGLLSLFVSCGGGEDPQPVRSAGSPVEVVHPTTRTMADRVSLNGNTIFLKKEIIRSTFDGFVATVYKNVGDAVQPATGIFRVKTKELAATDSATLSLGNRLFEGAVSIRARSAGIVTEIDFHEGDYVTAGEQLAIVANPTSLRIRLNVPYELASTVKIGGACEVLLPNGDAIPGIIEKSVPSVDLTTQTQTFLITLQPYQALPENLNVIVTFAVRRVNSALVLPKSCIMTNVTQDAFWIMMLTNDTTAVKVPVEKGIENDSLVQIVHPALDGAERVIAHGAYGLPDSAKVEIVG